MRYAGNLKNILKKKKEKKEKKEKEKNGLIVFQEPLFQEPLFNEERFSAQTFPENSTAIVHRQVDGQLTCGMRCLQNMYGKHIVSREEMDRQSKKLEMNSHGIKMYNPECGFYHMEVLEALLQEKGKHVQRIALEKISSDYYIPMVELNPTFTGYIVALGIGVMKHYITVRYNGQYKRIDSLPGVQPQLVASENLFQRYTDGNIYCSGSETQPVVAVLAIGGSPFVEYNVLHDSWTDTAPHIDELKPIILEAFDYQPKTLGQKQWFLNWKQKRTPPDAECLELVVAKVRQQFEKDKEVIVHYKDDHTIIRCKTFSQLLRDLKSIKWISDIPFVLKQDGKQVYHSGMKEENINWKLPIHLTTDDHPQIGGFYTFNSSVAGICTKKQENAYSVLDRDGTLHVLYKKAINNIMQ
jgi:hypothetical protein